MRPLYSVLLDFSLRSRQISGATFELTSLEHGKVAQEPRGRTIQCKYQPAEKANAGRQTKVAWLAVILTVLWIGRAVAQGGPPMITDDPGTPGNGHWENNLAIAFSHVPNQWSIDAPAIDLNYGLGDYLQLTLQGGPSFLKRGARGLIGGLGGTEVAVKWRFLNEESSGVDMSMFPRIRFNVLQSSVRRGLAEGGTRFQIPFQAAKKVGPTEVDIEFGPLVNSVGPSEFLYGIVVGRQVTKTTSLMAEVHAVSRMNLDRDVVTVNFGWRHRVSEHASWIGSIGYDVHSGEDAPLALIGYCGVQLLY